MDKVWRNFLFSIIAVLIGLLVFTVVYEEISSEKRKESLHNISTTITVDTVTLYDQNGNVLYQCCTENDIKFNITDDEISIYVPYQLCSCYSDEAK